MIQKLAGLSGGAERVLVDVANGLAARGLSAEIVSYERNGGPPSYPLEGVAHRNLFPRQVPVTADGPAGFGLETRVKGTPNVFPLGQIKWHLTYGAFIRALRRHLTESRPDVVIGFMPTGIMVGAMAAKDVGIRSIGSTHNLPEEDFGTGPRWDPNPIYRKRRVDALALLDRLLVLQPEFKGWFAPSLHPKIEVMPNPIMATRDPVVPPEDRAHIVLSVGRLTRVKRHSELLKAWVPVAEAHPEWRLRIYGEGPEQHALEAQIKSLKLEDTAELCGVTSEIFARYEEASILCHPAEFEGFGLTVAEALARGLPVIASKDCPGVNGLVEDGRNGLLVQDGPTFEVHLGKALNRLIKAKGLRARMGRAGPMGLTAYAPEVIYDKWETLIRGLMARR